MSTICKKPPNKTVDFQEVLLSVFVGSGQSAEIKYRIYLKSLPILNISQIINSIQSSTKVDKFKLL